MFLELTDFYKKDEKFYVIEVMDDLKKKMFLVPAEAVKAFYYNGNAKIMLLFDGTRLIKTIKDEDDAFDFDYPLNMDVKITNKCSQGCPQCHEKSIPSGKHASLESLKFMEQWCPGVEIAFGGGSVTEHPQFREILEYTKECGIVANTTLHINEFIEHIEDVKDWQKNELVNGIGISYPSGWVHTVNENTRAKLIEGLSQTKNVVFHIIVGLVTRQDIEDIIKICEDAHIQSKVLLLGYKTFGRGKDYLNESIKKRIEDFNSNYNEMVDGLHLTSFDNLALEQLHMKDRLSEDEWLKNYQGEEGSSNMYIDAVNQQFALCSIAETRYPLLDDLEEMFKIIKANC